MSTSLTPSLDPASQTYWRLFALAIDPDRTTPELYGLIYEAETDVPLMLDGRIVLFADPRRARDLIEQHGGALIADHIEVDKPFSWCDVAQTLHFLSAGGYDDGADVLDTVNVLLDLVKATGIKFDERRKKALHSIADYCTFSKDVTKYLEEDGDYSGRELIDAVLWCVGVVAVKTRIV